jgi:hypothetical protein
MGSLPRAFPILNVLVVLLGFGSCTPTTTAMELTSPSLVVATRLHLGNASTPPSQESLDTNIRNFYDFCGNSCRLSPGLIAVDSTPKLQGYSLVEAVQAAIDKLQKKTTSLHVLPVSPWGKFVPALNALIGHACKYEHQDDANNNNNNNKVGFDQILFVSAETTASAEAVDYLRAQIAGDTLVAGAVLAGHDHHPGDCVTLTGRSSPWNTLAVWDLRKLALTGFQLVSDGLLTDDQEEPSFGIEEVVATALLQKILGSDQAKSKLVKLPPGLIDWQVDDFEDPERKKWQEEKMRSKGIRAQRQLDLIGLQGTVHHC